MTEVGQVADLAARVAQGLAVLPGVVAVAMGGSRGHGGLGPDDASDLDLEVYTRGDVPVADRRDLVAALGGATRSDLGMDFWGPGDEWLHAPTGTHVDVVFFDAAWMEDRVAAVLDRHEASLGYTTCFWHTVRGCVVLADETGWLRRLQARVDVPYPEALRASIVTRNHPVLRAVLPSYANQLAAAVARRDLVSIQHRLTGLLASYADIVFALNRRTHPGEKRLVEAMSRECPRRPTGMAHDIEELLRTATTDLDGLGVRVDRLLDRLDDLLRAEGFTPAAGGLAGSGPR
ncbi:MAG: DUF4037 domain-containing protein [Chloroflexota bacterium]